MALVSYDQIATTTDTAARERASAASGQVYTCRSKDRESAGEPVSKMKLQGSCHCGGVRFSVRSAHPYPYNLCYCSICRKTAGGGGFAINLGADNSTLEIEGKEHITVYSADVLDEKTGKTEKSPAQRSFCRVCGTALWAWDPRWPELVHPFASGIDSELPVPPERTHLMVGSKASWVELRAEKNDLIFDAYPEESIAEWHMRLNLEDQSD